mgnify:CR=1 FL=1
MSRRLKLIARLQETLENPVTESERRRAQRMLTELMRMESESSVEDSWRGEVDRQAGSFTNEEILNSKAWR